MKKGTIKLKNEKLLLREYRMNDIETIYEKLGCNPEMMRHTGWNPYHSIESTEEFINKIIQGYESGTDDYSWIIESDGKTVGTIGAYNFNKDENSIEIGYSIFQEFWGKGYASQALNLVCQYLMLEKGVYRLKAWTIEDNIASKKLLEKLGFVQTKDNFSCIDINGDKIHQLFYEKI